MEPNAEPQTPHQRVAVIAVHGVGDHPPRASAREIADLLSNLSRSVPGAAVYTPFTEVNKRIGIHPVNLGASFPDEIDEKRTWGPMDAIARAVRMGFKLSAADNNLNSLDHLFTKGQLLKYNAHEEPDYPMLREEGKRLPSPNDPPGTPEKIVHIYEMYWADLSRLGNAVTRIFGELYQLLFHLGSVAVNNLNATAAVRSATGSSDSRAWFRFARAEWSAAAALAWPIPILNLVMAAFLPAIFVVSLLRSHASVRTELVLLDLLVAVAALLGCILWLRQRRVNKLLHVLPLPLISVIAATVYYRLRDAKRHDPLEYAWAAVLSAAGIAAAFWIITIYEKRRPGSIRAALIIGGIFVVAALAVFLTPGLSTFLDSNCPPLAVLLNAEEIAGGMLAVAWALFFASYFWAYVEGWLVVLASPRQDRPSARRVRWTARLVLSLCASSFIFFTVLLWAGVVTAGAELLPDNLTQTCSICSPTPMTYYPITEKFAESIRGHAGQLVNIYLSQLAKNNPNELAAGWARYQLIPGGILFIPTVAVMLLALLILLWALGPSLLGEIAPPDEGPGPRSTREMAWLDDGFWFLRFPGILFFWLPWIPLVLLIGLWYARLPQDTAVISTIERTLGSIAAAAALGMMATPGNLKRLALGLRPALRAMLDVDAWLREHPRDSNPTARICARYVSLLRHIAAWKDDGVHGYDTVVIIAHSQGTVITADLLRYLNAEKIAAGSMHVYDPTLSFFDHRCIWFFTMGCPLRQLYGLRFPYLYGYASETKLAPDPDKLGVRQWDNGFRSADYVGRKLWPAVTDGWTSSLRSERLIGPGAHTHYWDGTAAAIAERLDVIVRDA